MSVRDAENEKLDKEVGETLNRLQAAHEERDRYKELLGEAVTLIKEHGCGNYSLALTQWLRRVEGEAKV